MSQLDSSSCAGSDHSDDGATAPLVATVCSANADGSQPLLSTGAPKDSQSSKVPGASLAMLATPGVSAGTASSPPVTPAAGVDAAARSLPGWPLLSTRVVKQEAVPTVQQRTLTPPPGLPNPSAGSSCGSAAATPGAVSGKAVFLSTDPALPSPAAWGQPWRPPIVHSVPHFAAKGGGKGYCPGEMLARAAAPGLGLGGVGGAAPVRDAGCREPPAAVKEAVVASAAAAHAWAAVAAAAASPPGVPAAKQRLLLPDANVESPEKALPVPANETEGSPSSSTCSTVDTTAGTLAKAPPSPEEQPPAEPDEGSGGWRNEAASAATALVIRLAGWAAEGAPAVPPTRGSAKHFLGACKPCAFVFKGGCASGPDCEFCHLCELGEKRRRKKAFKGMRQVAEHEGAMRSWSFLG